MTLDRVLLLVESAIDRQTGKPLSDLQQAIITKVWQGKKYLEIADEYGCTEGHAKDTGSLLWKTLSEAWNKKVTKGNFRSLIKKQLQLRESSDLRNNRTQETSQILNFIGRQTAIADLQNLQQQGNKIVVIQAEGGIGKTTLAQQFLAEGNFDLILEVLMAKERHNIVAVESIVEEWLTRDFNEESGKELGVTLARLKRCLSPRRVGILIDN